MRRLPEAGLSSSRICDDVVGLEAAVRSWPPVAPRCQRWAFPVWTVADELDPTLLRSEQPKRTRPEEKQQEWNAKRFTSTFVQAEPKRALRRDGAVRSQTARPAAGGWFGTTPRNSETRCKKARNRGRNRWNRSAPSDSKLRETGIASAVCCRGWFEHESLLSVVQELERRGWVNKRWTARTGCCESQITSFGSI